MAVLFVEGSFSQISRKSTSTRRTRAGSLFLGREEDAHDDVQREDLLELDADHDEGQHKTDEEEIREADTAVVRVDNVPHLETEHGQVFEEEQRKGGDLLRSLDRQCLQGHNGMSDFLGDYLALLGQRLRDGEGGAMRHAIHPGRLGCCFVLVADTTSAVRRAGRLHFQRWRVLAAVVVVEMERLVGRLRVANGTIFSFLQGRFRGTCRTGRLGVHDFPQAALGLAAVRAGNATIFPDHPPELEREREKAQQTHADGHHGGEQESELKHCPGIVVEANDEDVRQHVCDHVADLKHDVDADVNFGCHQERNEPRERALRVPTPRDRDADSENREGAGDEDTEQRALRE
mmetsp:Transcript_23628/g.72687  ORF Transcript_23628/g.72687 Transcript_23628/m.72687 type:complete len:347 (+) Transcript_23628:889-1929(+)